MSWWDGDFFFGQYSDVSRVAETYQEPCVDEDVNRECYAGEQSHPPLVVVKDEEPDVLYQNMNWFTNEYRLITVEFLSTFIYRPRAPDQPEAAPQPAEVSFRLCGGAYEMSLAEFGNALGLYTEEELTMAIYTSAIYTADDAVVSAWWPRIGDEPFVRAARVTRRRDPLIRYLHRVISSSITGCGMSQEWCTGRPCNVARCLAEYFSTYYHRQERGLIFGGVYVTRLARANVLIDIEPAGMQAFAPVHLDKRTVQGMRVVQSSQGWGFDFPFRRGSFGCRGQMISITGMRTLCLSPSSSPCS
ncbi:hypothetical protein R6Q57_006882 [Mikania cordata]